MNPLEELKEKGIITHDNKIESGVIRCGFRELYIKTDPLSFQYRELDDDQRIQNITLANAPYWVKPYVKALLTL